MFADHIMWPFWFVAVLDVIRKTATAVCLGKNLRLKSPVAVDIILLVNYKECN